MYLPKRRIRRETDFERRTRTDPDLKKRIEYVLGPKRRIRRETDFEKIILISALHLNNCNFNFLSVSHFIKYTYIIF